MAGYQSFAAAETGQDFDHGFAGDYVRGPHDNGARHSSAIGADDVHEIKSHA